MAEDFSHAEGKQLLLVRIGNNRRPLLDAHTFTQARGRKHQHFRAHVSTEFGLKSVDPMVPVLEHPSCPLLGCTAQERISMDPPKRFVRLNEFISLMGWSRTTFYNRMKAGALPRLQSNGPRTKGYYADKVADIQKSLDK